MQHTDDSILVVDSVELARGLESTLRAVGVFSVDVETVGCNPKKQSPVLTARIVCWSVAWTECTALPHADVPGVYQSRRAFIPAWSGYEWTLDYFKPLLQDASVAKCMHNGDYDVQCFANHGIWVVGLAYDTKHMSRFWYASKDIKHDLKSQMSGLLGYRVHAYTDLFSRPVQMKPKVYKRSGYVTKRVGPLAGVRSWVEAGSWPTFSHAERELLPLDTLHSEYPDRLPALQHYASFDAKGTEELRQYRTLQLTSRAASKGRTSLQVYSDIWQPMMNELRRMERAGITVDRGVCETGYTAAMAEADALLPELHAWAGSTEFNFRSPDQLRRLLFTDLGLPHPPIQGTLKAVKPTKSHEWGTSEAAVYWLELHCPEHASGLGALRRWRKTVKSAQYLRDLPGYIASDGRVHTVIGPEADSGRLAARNPALQQIPGNDVYGIRRSFVAKPGHKLVVADMSQLEVYVLAHVLLKLFDDNSVYAALQSGDVYSWIAKTCWPDKTAGIAVADIKAKHPKLRALAKILVLASNYGKTAQGIALSLLDETGEPATEDFCNQLLATYYNAMPGVTRWHRWSGDYAQKHGGIHTLLGRWRPIPAALSSVKWQVSRGRRQAMNTPIQGGAADLMSCALLGLARNAELSALGAVALLQVHDELIYEVPECNADAALQLITAGMEVPPSIDLLVKLKAEAKIASNWAEGK